MLYPWVLYVPLLFLQFVTVTPHGDCAITEMPIMQTSYTFEYIYIQQKIKRMTVNCYTIKKSTCCLLSLSEILVQQIYKCIALKNKCKHNILKQLYTHHIVIWQIAEMMFEIFDQSITSNHPLQVPITQVIHFWYLKCNQKWEETKKDLMPSFYDFFGKCLYA